RSALTLTISMQKGHSNSMTWVEAGLTGAGSSAKALAARASTSSGLCAGAAVGAALGTGMVSTHRHLGQLTFFPASDSLTPRVVRHLGHLMRIGMVSPLAGVRGSLATGVLGAWPSARGGRQRGNRQHNAKATGCNPWLGRAGPRRGTGTYPRIGKLTRPCAARAGASAFRGLRSASSASHLL